MKRINRLFCIFGLVALILSACQPILPPVMQNAPAVPVLEQAMPAAPDAEPRGVRADAPPYAVHGPYAVGLGNFEIAATAENERPLTVTVWYPALNPQGAQESVTYAMGFPAGETPNISVFGHAIENAAPAVDGAPYPLIVHTHGHWSFRQETAYLDEHLASMGFVVISADHEDNWSTLFGPKAWQSEFRRPNEVTRQIDYAEELGVDGGALAGIVDTGRVGVFGWSYGGETALVAAGARLDLGKLRAWCEENTVDGNVPDTDCVDILDHEAELAALAGLNETPQGLWPDWSDDRVDAVIGLAPWVGSLSEASLQTLNVPTLLMIGSSDTAAGPTYRPFQPYQKITAERKAEVVFENAEHFLFFSACKDVPEVVDLGLEIFCTDPVWDMQRGHDLIAHFTTAFLLAELKDDTDAATALAPENVAFTGVQYQETGYSTSEVSAAAEPEPPHGLRFDAPEYAIDGPYAVGVRYVNIPAATENDRDLIATVWYPAQKSGNATGEMVYDLQFAPGEIPGFTVLGHAQLDAPPDASGAPYPLVVYSHATWSFGQETPYFTEHLASRGFVIISADHEDNWSTAFAPAVKEAMIHRPQEATREIDFAESLAVPSGELPGMIDTTGVGVAGWSMGGETALALGGARWDTNGLRAWCVDDAAADVDACLDEFAVLAGLEETPQGLWPARLDERVRAVIPLASYTLTFGKDGMESVDVPVLFMVGSGAVASDRTFAVDAPYKSAGTERKAKVVFDYGEALLIFSSCADSPSIASLGFPMFCTDPVWDMDRAHDLINHFATAFLLAELKGDTDAAAALAPENVSFSGVQYEATGYETVSEAAPQSGLDDATIAEIETILTDTMQPLGVPGYAMCIVKDGSVVYDKGFGVTKAGGDQLVTPQSVFAIYSTTKSFTAVALMQLVEQGKVDLDAPVTTYLPYFTMADPGYEQITVRMLASHTSGLIDDDIFANMPPKSEEPGEIGAAIEWFVHGLADDPLTAAPPTDWQYASTNFILLGDIIGKVSGEPYDVYVTQHLLEPLGMAHSTLDATTIPADALVGEHITTADGVVEALPQSNGSRFETPAGGIYATCEDMTRWMQVHVNRGELDGVRILQANSYETLWKREASTGMDEFFGVWIGGQALGWAVGEDGGHFLAGHPGGGAGQTSNVELAPDDNLGVTVLTNWGMDDSFPAWTAAVDALYVLLGINPQ